MRGRHTRPPEEADVDLTPMLDVVFILLIFFIVTATFTREQALGAEPPPPPPPPDQIVKPEPSVLIFLDQDGLVYVNGRLTEVGNVRPQIERLRAENPDSSVIIQAHPRAKSGNIILIRDQAQSADVDRVNIVLSQEEE